MSRDLQSIDVATIPELARLADEVERSGRPWALRRGPRTVAVVVPATSTLDAGYQSIPALDPPREWDEAVRAAADEHATKRHGRAEPPVSRGVRRDLALVERGAGMLKRYAPTPPLTAEQERDAFERGVAEEVTERMGA